VPRVEALALPVAPERPDHPDAPLLPPPPRPARLTITRRAPDDVGFREVYVLIDGEEIAELPYGASVTREIDAGLRRLRAHNTLFRKTREVLVAPGDHVHVTVANRPGWGTFGLLGVLGAAPLFLHFEVSAIEAPADDH
jgi:hypothetical protein